MLMIFQRYVRRLLQELALGYAWIALLPTWRAGVPLALLTFAEPAVGVVGSLSAICAWYAGQIAGSDAAERPVCVFNGLLSGLFVAHLWLPSLSMLMLAVLGGIFSGWLTVVFARLAWSLVRLPILSLPFALGAMLTSAASSSMSNLQFRAYVAPPELFGNGVDPFLNALGALYFMPNPWAGLLVLLCLLVVSRYFVVLAVLAYVLSSAWLTLLGAAPEHLASTAWDSNAMLAALLVGGLFATPSLLTAGLAMLAAVLAAWLALALGRLLDVAHLVPFSVPFVLASWLVLYAAVRNTTMASSFNLLLPDFPERSYERACISRERIGEPGSVPVGLPYMGQWAVSQGFSGAHTHKGPWRHALDFMVLKGGKSFVNRGSRLEDFYCYNLPVISPVYGQVWRIANDVPDNVPGAINVSANWGNYVVIKLYEGRYLLLAHLKPGSLVVAVGAWVKPGDLLGHCGNSGRSPQPHIHMHVQTSDEPGSPTAPFHLASVMLAEAGQAAQYKLVLVPPEGAVLTSAQNAHVRPLYLLVGRGLRYTVAHNENTRFDWTLRCEVDDLGRLVLVSSRGARCVAESTWAVFSCYERNAVADPYFDLWLLACGYNPASFDVDLWQDAATPAYLFPNLGAKLWARCLWPWATFARSEHRRFWDEQLQAWRQEARHRQGVSQIEVKTQARIAPQIGCVYLTAQIGSSHYTLQATSSFQRADMGVPAWEVALA
jgi:urea transporter